MERFRRAPESQPEAQLATTLTLLEQGVAELLDSERFADYLRAMGTFHDYSFNNILLIVSQKSDATRVADFRAWKSLGRYVRSGEHGIKIIVPRLREAIDPETREQTEQLTGFGLGTVFDVSQPEGKPLPDPLIAEELRRSSEAGRLLYQATRGYLNEQPGCGRHEDAPRG